MRLLVSFIFLVTLTTAQDVAQSTQMANGVPASCKWGRKMRGYHSVGTIMATHDGLSSMVHCANLCMQTLGCQSVNYNTLDKVCELSSKAGPMSYKENTDKDPFWQFFKTDNPASIYLDGFLCPLKSSDSVDRSSPVPQTSTQQQNPQQKCGQQAPGFEPHARQKTQMKNARGKSRIVGGRASKPFSWPWQVALFKNNGEQFFGGAVLLREDVILTAAHIIDDAEGSPITAVAGAYMIAERKNDPDVDIANVVNYVRHRAYDTNTSDNDIALLLLDRKIRFGPKKQVPCLPASGTEPAVGESCAVTGFGLLKEHKNRYEALQLPTVLQEAYVNVIDKNVCNSSDHYGGQITQHMFCAGFLDGLIDACQGDSGGPFVCKTGDSYTLYGLISWGDGCAEASKPGVYTKVSNFLDWIETSVEVLRKAGPGQGISN